MTTRRVAWRRSDEVETDEHCTLTLRDSGLALVGTVLGSEGGVPVRIEYKVLADGAGMTTAAHVRDLRGFETQTIALERDAKGNWTVNGTRRQGAQGLHRRRPRLQPVDEHAADPPAPTRASVASSTIKAAWVRFPGLDVVKAAQTYTRLDEFTYRYKSGTFEAELTVDDDGLVAAYAEWRRTGVALGPGDSEPLDSIR